jgi:hypothetical protein
VSEGVNIAEAHLKARAVAKVVGHGNPILQAEGRPGQIHVE